MLWQMYTGAVLSPFSAVELAVNSASKLPTFGDLQDLHSINSSRSQQILADVY